MDENNNSEQSVSNTANLNSVKVDPVHDLVFTIKANIDQHGKYKYRLNDMAMGYAAATGTTSFQAKAEIEDKFTQSFGRSPHEYLERHYNQLRETSQSRKASRAQTI